MDFYKSNPDYREKVNDLLATNDQFVREIGLETRERLIREGYDGVYYPHDEEHGFAWIALDNDQIKSTLDPEMTDWQRQHIQDIASEHHKSVGPLIGEEPSPKQATRVGDPSDYIDRIEQLAAMGKTLDDLDQNAMKEIGWDRGKKGLLNAVNKDWREIDPEFVNYKNYSDVPIDRAVAAMRKRLGDVMPESEPPAAFGFPPGFIDSFETQPNLYDVYNEGYMTHVKPLLRSV
jgi:hypothetical protein